MQNSHAHPELLLAELEDHYYQPFSLSGDRNAESKAAQLGFSVVG